VLTVFFDNGDGVVRSVSSNTLFGPLPNNDSQLMLNFRYTVGGVYNCAGHYARASIWQPSNEFSSWENGTFANLLHAEFKAAGF
jgi:hypothetical protein